MGRRSPLGRLRRQRRRDVVVYAPVPRQQLVEPMRRMRGDAREDMGEPGPGIDAVHLRCDDETIHGGGALAAAIRAAEQP